MSGPPSQQPGRWRMEVTVVGSMVTYSKVVRLFLYLGSSTAHSQNVVA